MANVFSTATGPADAPVVVLSNSLGATFAMWDAQMPWLRRFRVIRYDNRGHGRSPVPPGPCSIDDLAADVVALLDRHGVARASFCGLSLGGMVGMRLATIAPERVERLVLCCTSAQLGPPEGWYDRARLVRSEGTAAVADAVVGRWFTEAFRSTRPDAVAAFRAMIASTTVEGYASCCEAIAAMDQLDAIAAIRAPTLVIAASDDPATPVAHGQAIVERIPGARMVVIDDAAHLANVERPGAVSTAILAHLDQAYSRGLATRRAVLGDAAVDRATAAATAATAPFQDLITRYAWGDAWSDETLDRRTRSCMTLALLVALGKPVELALHVRAALRNGLSPDEISAVIVHAGIYCGVPAANDALAVAAATLATAAD